MRAAVVDVGTNSIKLAVAERAPDGHFSLLAQATTNPRLGEDVDKTHVLSPDAMARAVSALDNLLTKIQDYSVDRLRIAGTSAMRDAQNRQFFIEMVNRELGVDLEILSEEDECRLSYKAVALDSVLGGYKGFQVVADVGGGSSEMIIGDGLDMLSCKSVHIGAVRLTERHLFSDPPSENEIEAASSEAIGLLSEGLTKITANRAVGVGGSAVNLARMFKGIDSQSIDGVHGTVITRDHSKGLIDKMAGVKLFQRRQIVGLEPERVDIILGGAIILDSIMKVTGAPELIVSICGLRHGMLYEMLDN